MKRNLLVTFVLSAALAGAQSSLALKVVGSTSNIQPNASLSYTVDLESTITTTIDFTNTGTTPNTYLVKRYDSKLNVTAAGTSSAYFCIAGQCFGPDRVISPTVQLNPNQSASQLSGDYVMLDAQLTEAPDEKGLSVIKYTFLNTANSADSIQFAIRYNDSPTGLNSHQQSVSMFNIYPSPVKSNATLVFSSSKETVSRVQVYNCIGSVVYEKDVLITAGKNKVDLHLSALPDGVYFARMGDQVRKIMVE